MCLIWLCGKGGDLTKYKRSECIRYYTGVDIADMSVEHARERYSQGRFGFKAEFCSGGMFLTDLKCHCKQGAILV